MEQWKDIPEYEGIYQASNMGRIRTCDGKVTSSKRFKHRVWKQRVLKLKYQLRKGGRGYDARVCLWKDGKEATFLVSRLVAMAWCEGYSDNLTVNHIDGNPMNNCSDNLEWVSLADNIRKGFEDGLYGSQICVVLTDKDGNEKSFKSMSEASRSIGRNQGYISNIISRGKTTTNDGYSIRIIGKDI